eukprot:3278039-Prymnesium_polylepis.1
MRRESLPSTEVDASSMIGVSWTMLRAARSTRPKPPANISSPLHLPPRPRPRLPSGWAMMTAPAPPS